MSAIGSLGSTTPQPKRTLDIEQALQWAFRDELPKAQSDRSVARAPTMGLHPMWRAGVFGGRIDNWNNHDPGFPAAMGEPHPDAVLIGNAVKGCDVDKLDLWGFLIPYQIGEQFDLAGLIEKARSETVAVLINSATSRTRPDTSDRVAVEPVRSITGQITIWAREPRVYDDVQGNAITVEHDLPTKPIRKGVYPTGAFSKIRYCPSAATVALDRARYAGWWAGLAHVADLLRVMSLATIEITGPTAPRSPWTEDRDEEVPPQPLPSLRPQRMEILKERRIAGRRPRSRRASSVRQIFPPVTTSEPEVA